MKPDSKEETQPVFRATAELRWRNNDLTLRDPATGETVIIRREPSLQQLWQSDTGEQEWREVPSV